MKNLFISLYHEKNRARVAEFEECLTNNLRVFDKVFIIAEEDENGIKYLDWINHVANSNKIHILPCNVRPTFRTFFNAINTVTKVDEINAISNADIYFEDLQILPEYNQCFALTRYEKRRNGPTHFLNRIDSQDSYIFKNYIKTPKYCDFFAIPGCDNRICAELNYVGYEMLNPSLTIKTFHLHEGEKSYDGSIKVQKPYMFLTPIEL